jgi:DNA-binding ferritin-like protein
MSPEHDAISIWAGHEGDEATASLLADRLTYHEKQVWMMKSLTAS